MQNHFPWVQNKWCYGNYSFSFSELTHLKAKETSNLSSEKQPLLMCLTKSLFPFTAVRIHPRGKQALCVFLSFFSFFSSLCLSIQKYRKYRAGFVLSQEYVLPTYNLNHTLSGSTESSKAYNELTAQENKSLYHAFYLSPKEETKPGFCRIILCVY